MIKRKLTIQEQFKMVTGYIAMGDINSEISEEYIAIERKDYESYEEKLRKGE